MHVRSRLHHVARSLLAVPGQQAWLLPGLGAPVMTPNGVNFSFLFFSFLVAWMFICTCLQAVRTDVCHAARMCMHAVTVSRLLNMLLIKLVLSWYQRALKGRLR